MDHDYEGYWQGIAVHNGDPMKILHMIMYCRYISGYPSGLVDRGSVIDPSAFSGDFLQRIVIIPSALLNNDITMEIF